MFAGSPKHALRGIRDSVSNSFSNLSRFVALLFVGNHTVKFGLRGERVPRAEIFVRFSARAFTRFV